jgi:hypothetical protein
MRARSPLLGAVLVLALCACGDGGHRSVTATPGGGVLFVGNSLTAANDLPAMVEALAAAGGHALPVTQFAFPGFSLSDHLSEGEAPRTLAAGGWRVVVLQQGPSGQPDSRVLLREDTATFDAIARKAGARTALFSVWADSAGPSTFDEVRESYSLAAADVGGMYLPVNEAWVLALARRPALPLYAADGFHPSIEGSYLAALVIASVITGEDAARMPALLALRGGGAVAVDGADATLLREAAAAAVAASAR